MVSISSIMAALGLVRPVQARVVVDYPTPAARSQASAYISAIRSGVGQLAMRNEFSPIGLIADLLFLVIAISWCKLLPGCQEEK
jgi:hypothetical protein